MGNADTGKEEDTSEEDTKNAEKSSLLYKFPRISFEPLFASDIAEIEGFSFKFDLKLRRLLIQNHAANRIPRHCLALHYSKS